MNPTYVNENNGSLSGAAKNLAVLSAAMLALVMVNFLCGRLADALMLKYSCWQMTGLRAAGAAVVIAACLQLGKSWMLAALGVGFGVYLAAMHPTYADRYFAFAMFAGVAAYAAAGLLQHRPTLAIVLAAILFNVLLGSTRLWSAWTLGDSAAVYNVWLPITGIRIGATLLVLIPLLALWPAKRAA